MDVNYKSESQRCACIVFKELPDITQMQDTDSKMEVSKIRIIDIQENTELGDIAGVQKQDACYKRMFQSLHISWIHDKFISHE